MKFPVTVSMNVTRWISILLAAVLTVTVLILQFSISSGLNTLKVTIMENSKKDSDSAASLVELLEGQAKKINKCLEVTAEMKSRTGTLQKQIASMGNSLNLVSKENMLPNDKKEELQYTDDNPAIKDLYAEGKALFQAARYSDSIDLYKRLLILDSTSTEAIVYYNASLFYLNPGDESNYYRIRKSLESALTKQDCREDLQQIIRGVYRSISREDEGSE